MAANSEDDGGGGDDSSYGVRGNDCNGGDGGGGNGGDSRDGDVDSDQLLRRGSAVWRRPVKERAADAEEE